MEKFISTPEYALDLKIRHVLEEKRICREIIKDYKAGKTDATIWYQLEGVAEQRLKELLCQKYGVEDKEAKK